MNIHIKNCYIKKYVRKIHFTELRKNTSYNSMRKERVSIVFYALKTPTYLHSKYHSIMELVWTNHRCPQYDSIVAAPGYST